MGLDNADDTEIFFSPSDVTSPEPARTDRRASKDYLARYIPECSHGSILVTTRNTAFGHSGTQRYHGTIGTAKPRNKLQISA